MVINVMRDDLPTQIEYCKNGQESYIQMVNYIDKKTSRKSWYKHREEDLLVVIDYVENDNFVYIEVNLCYCFRI